MSFDGMMHLYNETRVFDPGCFKAALDHLVEQFPPRRFPHVFEPGIGTGRIAIPVAQRGYRVTGVDISDVMLGFVRRRLARSKRPVELSLQVADVTDLPFADATFDMALAVHLFYFVADWRKAAGEILRVVKPGHPFVLMHTGTGMEIPALNQRYRELCAQHGHRMDQIGVGSTAELVAYLKTYGCTAHPAKDAWRWVSRIRLDTALSYLKARAYSFTMSAPDHVHSIVTERLDLEMREQFGSLAAKVEIPNQIYYVAVTRR